MIKGPTGNDVPILLSRLLPVWRAHLLEDKHEDSIEDSTAGDAQAVMHLLLAVPKMAGHAECLQQGTRHVTTAACQTPETASTNGPQCGLQGRAAATLLCCIFQTGQVSTARVGQYSLCAHSATSGAARHDAAVLHQCGWVVASSFA